MGFISAARKLWVSSTQLTFSSRNPVIAGAIIASLFAPTFVAMPAAASTVVTTNLFLQLDAGRSATSAVWTDLSLNGRSAAMQGFPTLVSATGSAPQHFNFSGGLSSSASSQHATVTQSWLDFSGGFTAQAKVNFGGVDNWERIFDFGDGPDDDVIFLGRHGNTNDLILRAWTGSTYRGECLAANAIENNTWVNYAMTISSSGSCQVYKNGVLYHALSTTSTLTSLPGQTMRANHYIARSNWGSNATFEGQIRSLFIYGSALSQAEVSQNFLADTTQTITFNSPSNTYLDSGTVSVTPTTDIGVSPTLASTTLSVCSVSGTTVTLLAAGSCNLTASSVAQGGFQAASNVARSFTVAPRAGLNPIFGEPRYDSGNWIFPITNYDANFTWTYIASSTFTVGTPSGSTVEVSVASPTGSATLTAQTTRTGYGTGRVKAPPAELLGTCLPSQTVSGGFVIARFVETGTCTWTVPSDVTSVNALVVGGGGAGGNQVGGGGGAGALKSVSGQAVTPSATLDITVGAGGLGSKSTVEAASNGGTSSLGNILVSRGGGGGGSAISNSDTFRVGQPGSSGGGAASPVITASGGSATVGEGYAGGAGLQSGTNIYFGGGGGGASAVGVNATISSPGTGGNGVTSSITGSSVCFATGGGGARHSGGTATNAGSCGGTANPNGGLGGTNGTGYTSALANTGSGGGGSGSINFAGGSGGSGVVILRYQTSGTMLPNAGTPTVTPTPNTVRSINVSWTEAANASSYAVRVYNPTGSALLERIDGVVGSSLTIDTSNFPAIQNATNYLVSVQAIGSGSLLSSAESTRVSVTTNTQYSFTFNSQGGTSVAASVFVPGGTVTEPTPPTKANFTFGGWSTSSASSNGVLANRISTWPYAPSGAAAVTVYAIWLKNLLVHESFTDTDGTNLAGRAGSGSTGLSGSWQTVQGLGTSGRAIDTPTFATFSSAAFPANSGHSVPGANTAARALSSWYPAFVARQLSDPVSFDVDSTLYMSGLITGTDGFASFGLLDDLPTSSSDGTKWSLLGGQNYTGKFGMDFGAANRMAWLTTDSPDSRQYTAVAASAPPANPSGNTYFMLMRVKTSASGQDEVSIKVYTSADTLPSSDSAVAWDVQHSLTITGQAKYLTVQLEHGSSGAWVDEVRSGFSFASVSPIVNRSTADPTLTYPSATYAPAGTVSPTISAGGHDGVVSYATSTASKCSVVASTGVVTIVQAGTCTITASYPQTASYSAASATADIEIAKANQASLVWDQDKITYDYLASLDLSSAVSGGTGTGTISFTPTGSCSVTASVLSGGDATSSCSVTATRGGDANYNPVSITQAISIAKIDQTALSIVNPGAVAFGDAVQLTSAGGSGTGAVTFNSVSTSICTESSTEGEFEFVGVGDCVVTVSKAADTNYNVQNGTRTIMSVKAAHTVSFTSSIPANPTVNGTYALAGVSSSGNLALAPAFRIVAGSASICSLSGSTLTFLLDGNCDIEAYKNSTSTYEAAPVASQRIVVGQANQNITFAPLANKTFGDPAFTVSATSSSNNAVSFTRGSNTTNNACSVTSIGLVVIADVGVCEVVADSAAGNGYAVASSVSRAFEVQADTAGAPFITAVSFGDQTLTATYFAPSYLGGGNISGYRLQAFSGSTLVATSTSCALSGTLSCAVTGLTNGTPYTLKIAALTQAGVGAISPASSAVSPAANPQAVSNLTAIQGNQKLTLSWSAPANLGGGTLDSYRIFHKIAGGAYSSSYLNLTAADAAAATSGGRTAFEITGLVNGQAYDVKVITVTTANTAQLSSNTAEVTQTPYTTPAAPLTVSVLDMPDDIVITWSQPVFDGGSAITGFEVLLDSVAATCAQTSPSSCSIPKTSLTPGATVAIDVKAENNAGLSPAVSTTFTVANTVVLTPPVVITPNSPIEGPATGLKPVEGMDWAWTKRISNNQVKVYIKFPEMGSNYQINLQKNDGEYVRKMSKTINTTSDADLRVVGESYYLVRTITLPGEGRYRIELIQDGERLLLNGQDRPAVYSYR